MSRRPKIVSSTGNKTGTVAETKGPSSGDELGLLFGLSER